MSFSIFDWPNAITRVTVTAESTSSDGTYVPEVTAETSISGHVSDINLKELLLMEPGVFQIGDRKISLETSIGLAVGDRLKIVELTGEETEWLVKAKQQTSGLLSKYAGVSRESFYLKRKL